MYFWMKTSWLSFILQLDVYDWDSDGSHDMIGGFTTTVEELAASQHGKEVGA